MTSIADKVAHVRSAGQTRSHHCHYPGCEVAVPPAMHMCKAHWLSLPKRLRDKIWEEYRIGQEETLSPSRDYLTVFEEVQAWCRKQLFLVNARQLAGRVASDAIYIGRGSPFGNPWSHVGDSKFFVLRTNTRQLAIEMYRHWLFDELQPALCPDPRIWPKPTHEQLMALAGRVLKCYCVPLPCHGEVILDYIERFADAGGFSPKALQSAVLETDAGMSEGSRTGTDRLEALEKSGSSEAESAPSIATGLRPSDVKPVVPGKGHEAEEAHSVPPASALSPPLRFVGGKSWLVSRLVPEILSHKPKLYVEPFLGAGAIALAMPRGQRMILSDFSEPLMNLWMQICRRPRLVAGRARMLLAMYGNTREGYNEARDRFNRLDGMARNPSPADAGPVGPTDAVECAALLLYLNATGYNGVMRVNKKGRFNVPFGTVKSPSICDGDELEAIANHFTNTKLLWADYREVLDEIRGANDAVAFCDPPYHAGFDDYIAGGFDDDEHRDLAERLHRVAESGVKVYATNAGTEFIRQIYSWATLESVEEDRNVAQKVKSRKAVPCLLIRGG